MSTKPKKTPITSKNRLDNQKKYRDNKLDELKEKVKNVKDGKICGRCLAIYTDESCVVCAKRREKARDAKKDIPMCDMTVLATGKPCRRKAKSGHNQCGEHIAVAQKKAQAENDKKNGIVRCSKRDCDTIMPKDAKWKQCESCREKDRKKDNDRYAAKAADRAKKMNKLNGLIICQRCEEKKPPEKFEGKNGSQAKKCEECREQQRMDEAKYRKPRTRDYAEECRKNPKELSGN